MSLQERLCLYFVEPGRIDIRREPMPSPQAGEVLVQSLVSAISPGTEMLFYRGQVPAGMAVDASLPGLSDEVRYPLAYGYACVGRVVAAGAGVDPGWLDRRVFAFHPHASHFCAPCQALAPLAPEVPAAWAAFLASAETAVNLVMDGVPLVGEQVVVFGQGVVGLLVTGLLARFPLDELFAVDPVALRLGLAWRLGATRAFHPDAVRAGDLSHALTSAGADLVFELSGRPEVLDQAIGHTGFGGRVVVGSWYGTKHAPLHLGGHFHRSRIQVISSQVSTIAPQLSGRWTKQRRLDVAWQLLETLPMDELVTQRFPFADAAEAYRLIDEHPETTVQVLLDYATCT